MLNNLRQYLTPSDFEKLNIELKDYSLNEEEIEEWAMGLPDDKFKSRYITIALINQVKNEGRFIVKREIKHQEHYTLREFYKRHNIVVKEESGFLFENLINYVLEHGCSLEDCRKATDYMIKKMNITDTDTLLETMKTAKLLTKYRIDIKIWEVTARKEWQEWESLTKTLEEYPAQMN